MDKSYRPWEPRQSFLLPPSPLDWLPEGDLAYFILDLMGQLDLSEIEDPIQDKDPRGTRPYNPIMMTALLLFAYCMGIPSSRKIEKATHHDLAFRVIAGGAQPDHTVISEFRRINLSALARLFLQVLQLCQKAGLVKLGHVALDGTKIAANASKHKAMSYGRMLKKEDELKAEIARMLEGAETADKAEDARFGPKGKEHDLPEELRRRESRLQKIQEALAALEADAARTRALELQEQAEHARARAQAEVDAEKREAAERRAEKTAQKAADAAQRAKEKAAERTARAERKAKQAADKAEKSKSRKEQLAALAAERGLAAAQRDQQKAEALGNGLQQADDSFPEHRVPSTVDGTPDPKAQRNFVDPDSRIMKTKTGFIQGYNAQIAVDATCQVIVAYGVTNQSPDAQHLKPMLSATLANGGTSPERFSADAGYWSDENAAAVAAAGIDAFIAVGRQKHGQEGESSDEPGGDGSEAKQQMQDKLRGEEGRKVYARRKVIAEPPFGQIKEAQGFRRFCQRGIERVGDEWGLICLSHNILKLFRFAPAPVLG